MSDHTTAAAAPVARLAAADITALADATGIEFTTRTRPGHPACLAAANLTPGHLRDIVRGALALHPDNGPLISALADPDSEAWAFGTLAYWPTLHTTPDTHDADGTLTLNRPALARLRAAADLDGDHLTGTAHYPDSHRTLTLHGSAADLARTTLALAAAHPGHTPHATAVTSRRTIDGTVYTWPDIRIAD